MSWRSIADEGVCSCSQVGKWLPLLKIASTSSLVCMSLERAYRACGICFEHNQVSQREGVDPDRDAGVYRGLRDLANFEAMRALEHAMETDASERGVAQQALSACGECTYKSAKIAELLKPAVDAPG